MSYSSVFFEDFIIEIPKIPEKELKKINAQGLISSDYLLDYSNYSVLHNPLRKFPYFTACNIDGALFKKIKRSELFSGKGDSWKKDSRIPKTHQLGHELYKADKSDFDKGHLTKREDVQWGKDIEKAVTAAESTYFFTNAMPQVDKLNRGMWRRIEDYILHHEVIKNNLKISLFSGPVFFKDDPHFVTKVNEEVIKLPYLFWKVIYYIKNQKLYRTGFLTSQKNLLQKRRIVKPPVRGEAVEVKPDLFMTFKDSETYQVRVDFIEKTSGLTFAKAAEVFVENTPEELIISGVDVRSDVAFDVTEANVNLIL